MSIIKWDDFWAHRRKNYFGRLIIWVRQIFVTPIMERFIIENTSKGTLIEAGCGTGEVTLNIAKQRGDHVYLVDYSSKALEIAKNHAFSMGITPKIVECDICDLSSHIPSIEDGYVFNIGVIEHYDMSDITTIIKEMAQVSGRWAFAVVPERSLFWRLYIFLSFKCNLVPDNFKIVLYSNT